MTVRLDRAFVALALVATLSGCMASGSRTLSHSVQKNRMGGNVDTYQVVDAGLGAQGDGYTFVSDHFRFDFDKSFDKVNGYGTPEQRFERGKEAHVYLNKGYEFVRDIFGVEASKRIDVKIQLELDGDANDARTTLSWMQNSQTGTFVPNSEQATMFFGMGAFESPSILAHEVSHAIVGIYGLPAWLDEGMASVVEHDYAAGTPLNGEFITLEPLGYDENGYNILQTWRGDENPLPFRSSETYGSAYAIIKEIQRRFGDDVFPKLFQQFQKTKPHLSRGRQTTGDIIRDLTQVTGRDVTPFFREIQFDVDSR